MCLRQPWLIIRNLFPAGLLNGQSANQYARGKAMAEIPVEKKSGKSWLWIILALILLALLAWWLLNDDGDEVVEYTDNDTVAASTATGAAAGAVAGAATAGTEPLAIGQEADLDNVRVTSVVGDAVFNIDAGGQNMLVVFHEGETPNAPVEGGIDINEGSVLSLEGTVRAASEPLPEGITAEIPAGTDRYILANRIEMER
jgi:hypothetical protein